MEAGDAGHLHYPDSPPDSIGTSSTSAQTNVHAGKRKCSGNHFAEEWKFKPGEKTCQDCLARKRQRNANKKRAAQEQLGREPCARCAKEVIGYRTQLHQLRLENGQLRAENAALQAKLQHESIRSEGAISQASPATKKDPLPVDAEVALRERDFVSWAFENPDLMEAEVDIDVLDPSSQVGLSEDSLWVDHDTLSFMKCRHGQSLKQWSATRSQNVTRSRPQSTYLQMYTLPRKTSLCQVNDAEALARAVSTLRMTCGTRADGQDPPLVGPRQQILILCCTMSLPLTQHQTNGSLQATRTVRFLQVETCGKRLPEKVSNSGSTFHSSSQQGCLGCSAY